MSPNLSSKFICYSLLSEVLNYPFILNIAEASDGYVATGSTNTRSIGQSDIWLLKVRKSGEKIIWSKNFGGRGSDGADAVIVEDGSYIIVGEIEIEELEYRGIVIKCADYAPPEVNIVRPKENYLYIFDREIAPSDKTTVIGRITVCIDIKNPANAEIKRAEYYIWWPGIKYTWEARGIIYSPPFEWKINTPVIGNVQLDCGVYYGNAEGVAADSMEMFIFNLI